MAYDEALAARLRQIFAARDDVVEKKMFGGLAFMLRGHMCCGVNNDALMARVGPDQYAAALALPAASEMDFTGRALTGFVFVAADGIESQRQLGQWVDRCTRFVDSLPAK